MLPNSAPQFSQGPRAQPREQADSASEGRATGRRRIGPCFGKAANDLGDHARSEGALPQRAFDAELNALSPLVRILDLVHGGFQVGRLATARSSGQKGANKTAANLYLCGNLWN